MSGELPCAVGRSFIDHIGRFDFGVAGGVGFIKEELDEGTLQAGAFTYIYRESGTGDFHAEVEVDEVVFLCKFPVGKCVGGKIGHWATGLFNHIVGGGSACGHHVAGEVGDGGEENVLLLFHLGQTCCDAFLVLLERAHLGLGFLGFLALALLHQGTY